MLTALLTSNVMLARIVLVHYYAIVFLGAIILMVYIFNIMVSSGKVLKYQHQQ